MTDPMVPGIGCSTSADWASDCSPWRKSFRADKRALPLADRHYNRQKVGSPQFVPPGSCYVLLTADADALWVTSWPKAEYVQHAWAGAWMNSTFRCERPEEGGTLPASSDLIRMAVGHTLAFWPDPPDLGMVTFVSPKHVPGIKVRGEVVYGYSYLKAGFRHVGFTKAGLWAWQMLPSEMPMPLALVSDGLPFGDEEAA
jgi:hypothetical protein